MESASSCKKYALGVVAPKATPKTGAVVVTPCIPSAVATPKASAVVVTPQGGVAKGEGVVPATKPRGVSTQGIVVGSGVVGGGGVVHGGGVVGGGVIFHKGGGPSVGSDLRVIDGNPGKLGRGLLSGGGNGGGGPGSGGGGGGASMGPCAGAGMVVVTPGGKRKPEPSVGAAPGCSQPQGQAAPVETCLSRHQPSEPSSCERCRLPASTN